MRIYKVLLCEDNNEIRDILEMALSELDREQIKLDIHATEDGLDAVKELENNKFDLMVTDLNMPRLDGRDLIRVIQEGDPINKNIPIIVISGDMKNLSFDKEQFVYTMEKPFDSQRFANVAKMALFQKEA